ncbi:MAG TPA: thermonuclease family protein [Reyranella sp.]|nr:thermonuclease family protein [Reyranella sp.]
MRTSIVLALALGWALPAAGQTVIDGDTLNYKGATLHLWGVDAPELGQSCGDGWPAGQIAKEYLAGLIHGRTVTCDLKSTPQPKPAFAVCKIDGQDLSAAMAADGMAWAYPVQTKDYTVQDSNAMIAVLGVHAHDCLKAWEWRARNQRQQ